MSSTEITIRSEERSVILAFIESKQNSLYVKFKSLNRGESGYFEQMRDISAQLELLSDFVKFIDDRREVCS